MNRAHMRVDDPLDDLILWQMAIDEVPLEDALRSAAAFLAPPDGYLLPRDDVLIAGVGRPGLVVASDRTSGHELWRRSADSLHAVAADGNTVVCLTDGEIAAHDVRSGTGLWARPMDFSGTGHLLLEVVGQRVFVGSKNGRLLALSLAAGDPLWSQQVVPPTAFPDGYLDIGEGKQLWMESSPEPRIIETQPAILDDRIVLGTYARSVVAFFIETGRRAWQWQLDAPAVGAIVPFQKGVVLHTRNRAYCLRGWDGWVLWQRDFPDQEITESFACGRDRVYLSTCAPTIASTTDAHGATIALDPNGVRVRRATDGAARLRADATTGLLYELSEDELSILEPEQLLAIREIGLRWNKRILEWAVTPEAIYLLAQSFSRSVTTSLIALRHPR